MSPAFKKITIALVVLTVAYAGYYFFTQVDTMPTAEGELTPESFAKVQKYIERRDILQQVTLDTSLFNDPRFRSFVGYTGQEATYKPGRINPFDAVDSSAASGS